MEESRLTFKYYGEDCTVSGTQGEIACLQSLLRNLPKAEDKTLRDYFAAKAIQNHPHNNHEFENIAEYAYCLADAMLKARESTKQE